MCSGVVTARVTRMGPLQREHTEMSTRKTRARSFIHGRREGAVMSRFDPGSSRRLVSGTARELAVGVREVSDKNVKRDHGRVRLRPRGVKPCEAVAALPEAAPQVDRTNREVYMLDRKTVDRDDFESFEASTTEVPGTWYCDEMSDGGETGWDVTDARGVVCEVRYIQEAEGVVNVITPKPR